MVTDSTDRAKGKFVTGKVTYPGGLASPLALNIFLNLSWILTVIGVTSGTEAERVSQIPPNDVPEHERQTRKGYTWLQSAKLKGILREKKKDG